MSSRAFKKWKLLLLFLPLLLPYAHGAAGGLLEEGIAAYRDGRYQEAEKCFQQIHKQHPENSNATYYLAMTQAQLGRFKQAKALYEEVLTLDPNSEAAKLAQEGLLYLPEDSTLDRPPRFQAARTDKKASGGSPQKTQPENTSPTTAMSPQEMMAWQMMMSQMGGTQGGLNPWVFMMMPQANGSQNGMPNIDPNVMSNILMNQMLQNFSLDGGNRSDNQ